MSRFYTYLLKKFIILLFFVSSIVLHAANNKKEIIYLSGTDNENTVTWDFYCTSGRNSGIDTTIEVPSHWEQQGFGEYNYGRDYHTYGKKFKFSDEKGIYKYRFNVPKSWNEKIVNIVFEGSMTDTEVKINGRLAGEIHQGSFYRFKYDITNKLKFGEDNLLEVTVSKMSANKMVNRAERYADYWIFGGIFRPVYLEIMPEEYIERVAIAAESDGSFLMDVFPQNIIDEKEIFAEIINPQNKIVATLSQKVNSADSILTLKHKLENPDLWNPETPSLYKINVYLKTGKKIVYSLTEKFGYRTIEVRQSDGIYVNNVKVKMKGINRHVFWPETGRCINSKINLMDVKLLKEMNMNAVRCAHYPPDKIFLDYCDSLGIFVINELAGWQNAYDTEVGEKLVKELVIRDVNHPSIIFWSNGNEGGHNTDLDDDYAIYDPSNRPVIHAHHKSGNDFNGIDCNHYEKYYSCIELLNDSNIYMPTEFLHGQDDGGMAAGLYDFWELFWKEDLSGGGFLWTFVDEGIARTDYNNFIDINRVNAPDGVLGPHREKEGSFYAIKEIFSPVKINLKELPFDFNGEIEVENRFHYTNLNDCKFKWQLVNFNLPVNRRAGHNVKLSGEIAGPDIKPLKKGNLTINLPENWKDFDALIIEAFDPFNEFILKWDWKIKSNEELAGQVLKIDTGDIEVSVEDNMLILSASGISVSFSNEDGTILKLENKYSPELSFSNGPVLVSGEAKPLNFKHFKDSNSYVIHVIYEGNLKYLQWRMFASGWLSLEYEYMVEGEQQFVGVSFDYPESNIIGVKWLGNGPYRVWKNRLQGVNFDVYQLMYNNTHTGSYPWLYPEFKGYFSDVAWMEFNTVEGKFLMVANEKDLFVRLWEFYSISGPVPHPDLPKGDISFLDGIPPTGTKLAVNIDTRTSELGPNSEPNVMDKPVKRKLYFYFGLPE